MFVKQLFSENVGGVAYFIESEGEAAVIDPSKDIEEYLLLAKERNARIKHVFKTHIQADSITRNRDLSKETSSPVVYGPGAKTASNKIIAQDGQVFNIGKLKLKVLHTPGRTNESACYLLHDEQQKAYAIFTGNVLLETSAANIGTDEGKVLTKEMALMLYESLQTKVLPLEDDVIVYPSYNLPLGKHARIITQSTIGEQKQNNESLTQKSKDAFVQFVTERQVTATKNPKINQRSNETGENIHGLRPLTVVDFKSFLEKEAIVVDTRSASNFASGFIPGSIFIGLDGKFAEWAEVLLPANQSLLLVTEKGKEEETVKQLSKLGFSKIEGYLQGGFDAWLKTSETTDLVIEVEPDELAMDIPFDENLVVVDVRKEVEFADGHVKDAGNIPLANMVDPASMADIEETDNLYLYCGSGYRSMIASSMLKRQGIHNLRNVTGGWPKIKNEPGIKTEKDAATLN